MRYLRWKKWDGFLTGRSISVLYVWKKTRLFGSRVFKVKRRSSVIWRMNLGFSGGHQCCFEVQRGVRHRYLKLWDYLLHDEKYSRFGLMLSTADRVGGIHRLRQKISKTKSTLTKLTHNTICQNNFMDTKFNFLVTETKFVCWSLFTDNIERRNCLRYWVILILLLLILL